MGDELTNIYEYEVFYGDISLGFSSESQLWKSVDSFDWDCNFYAKEFNAPLIYSLPAMYHYRYQYKENEN